MKYGSCAPLDEPLNFYHPYYPHLKREDDNTHLRQLGGLEIICLKYLHTNVLNNNQKLETT